MPRSTPRKVSPAPAPPPDHKPGPLEYVEGDAFPQGLHGPKTRACWLTDADDKVVACVTKDADFERSRVQLRHAAHCTKVLPDLVSMCEVVIDRLRGPDVAGLCPVCGIPQGTVHTSDCLVRRFGEAINTARNVRGGA
jgi:hypothetical protein